MWVRKQIDIDAKELSQALAQCFSTAPQRREGGVVLPASFLKCLSVRSAFDLLMAEVQWPSGSEVLMSAITIADMPRIVDHHGYRPVSVDIAPLTLAPTFAQIRRRMTSRTRAIVLTHLAGGSMDVEPIATFCRRENLMLIDDRAQAFVGTEAMIRDSQKADVSMWSFGPVKTSTALGGGLISVCDEQLRQRIRRRFETLPAQSNMEYAKRILKYFLIRFICRRSIAGGIAKVFQIAGTNHDRFASGLARGFAGDKFFDRIRRRPSVPLDSCVACRLARYDGSRIQRRRDAGRFLIGELGHAVPVLGSEMIDPTFWLFALLVEEPEPLIEVLWRNGFDATNRSSLVRVGAETSRSETTADRILRHMVILPVGGQMPTSELKRLAGVIGDANPEPPKWFSQERRPIVCRSAYPVRHPRRSPERPTAVRPTAER